MTGMTRERSLANVLALAGRPGCASGHGGCVLRADVAEPSVGPKTPSRVGRSAVANTVESTATICKPARRVRAINSRIVLDRIPSRLRAQVQVRRRVTQGQALAALWRHTQAWCGELATAPATLSNASLTRARRLRASYNASVLSWVAGTP